MFTKAIHDLEVINRDIATANEFVHTPWAREKELSEKSARLREVDRLIAEAEKNGQQYEQNVDSEEEQEICIHAFISRANATRSSPEE
mgnify:CR=1 FL=1